MKDEIQKALIDLEASLKELDAAAELIRRSEEASSDLIKIVSDLIGNVKVHLDSFKTFMEKWAFVLKSDTEKILDNYRVVAKNHEKIGNELLNNYRQLAEETMKLVKYLNSVNFPARLDKIDSTIASINSGIQNLHTQIADTKREISKELEGIVKKVDEISNAVRRIENNLTKISEQNEERFKILNQNLEIFNRRNTLINIVIIALILIILAVMLAPKFM